MPGSRPLEDYALLGDCRGAALVSTEGSIDWLCVPRFDSPACFAALLGTAENGRWLIAPVDPVLRTTRRYRDGTLVLETTFETGTGAVTLIDCLALPENDASPPCVVRAVRGDRGTVRLRMEWVLRFDYGSIVPWVTAEDHTIRAVAGPDAVRLHSPQVRTRGEGLKTIADFDVAEGDTVAFTMSYAVSHLPDPDVQDAERAIEATTATWEEWSSRSTYCGEFEDAVRRSLITLKALTYAPTGGIVAAPTTSLPEMLGGERNWDYRYCWIRDATITLYAMLVNGYTDEADAWRNWLLRAIAGSPSQTRILYGVAGERHVPELELPWLPGYEGSRPVRIGNGAQSQLQLDVYGELMDAMFQSRHSGLQSDSGWALERALLGHLEKVWREPDYGIWEIRGEPRHFTFSKVMVWVAFDRAVRSIEEFGLPGPVERYRELRDEVHAVVCAKGFSREANTFTQVFGGTEVDATLLLVPLVGFLPASDPRIVATVRAIERDLLIDDTFVLRYRTRPELDGLPEGEGAFLACSFWLVSNRVMQGQSKEARALFERLVTLCNDVGLLAEEYDPRAKRFLGNFPQAFSHLSLIDAAVSLSNTHVDPSEHRVMPSRTTRTGGRSSSTPPEPRSR